jgi:hypothetical protein
MEMASEILKDKDYDLISVVYHASQGCETTRQYAADAQRENDEEAAAFFNEALKLNARSSSGRVRSFSSSVCEMQLRPSPLGRR